MESLPNKDGGSDKLIDHEGGESLIPHNGIQRKIRRVIAVLVGFAAIGGAISLGTGRKKIHQDAPQMGVEKQKAPVISPEAVARELNARVDGPASFQDQVNAALPQVHDHLKSFGISPSEFSPLTSGITFSYDPTIKDNGTITPPDGMEFYLRDLNSKSYPISKPVTLDAVKINPNLNPHRLSITIVHEYTHHLMGFTPNKFFGEGIPEGMERHMERLSKIPRSDSDMKHIDALSAAGADRLPLAYVSDLDAFLEDKNHGFHGQDLLRRFAASSFWDQYFQRNPRFLPAFIKAVRLQIGYPQTSILSEERLVETAEEITKELGISSFKSEYQALPWNRKPTGDDKILGGKRFPLSCSILAGKWEITSITNADLNRNELIAVFRPFDSLQIIVNGNTPGSLSGIPKVFFEIDSDPSWKSIELVDPETGSRIKIE